MINKFIAMQERPINKPALLNYYHLMIIFQKTYCMAQIFGGRKLWWFAINKHFGGQNIGGSAPLHGKIARIKIVGG